MRRAESGFTLLEMLIALVVLGMLMAGLVRGVRTGIALWDAQTRHIGETVDLEAVARMLRTVLSGMPVPESQPAPGLPDRPGFRGEAGRLAFVGDLPTGLGGVRRVEITLELRNGRFVLAWRPHRHELTVAAPPPLVETELMRGVDRLLFAYWGRSSPDQPSAWLGQWDGPALPELIRVRVGLPKGDMRRWPDLIAAPRLWASEG